MTAEGARVCVQGSPSPTSIGGCLRHVFVQYVADVHLFALSGLAMFAS